MRNSSRTIFVIAAVSSLLFACGVAMETPVNELPPARTNEAVKACGGSETAVGHLEARHQVRDVRPQR